MLARFACTVRFVETIKAFHNRIYASFSTAGDVTEPIHVLAGVKQGSVLAPVLLNLFVAAVLHEFRTNMDGQIN